MLNQMHSIIWRLQRNSWDIRHVSGDPVSSVPALLDERRDQVARSGYLGSFFVLYLVTTVIYRSAFGLGPRDVSGSDKRQATYSSDGRVHGHRSSNCIIEAAVAAKVPTPIRDL